MNQNNLYEISLEHIELQGNHGVFEQERKVGNNFIVDLKVTVSLPESILEDSLKDTISYADLYNVLLNEFKIPSKLLEHVCVRIEHKLKQRWPNIQSGEIKIIKRQPPIAGITGWASVKKFF
ncbi:MAG: dihydroneopterin aldolase [Prevotella sp.]|nr:dihydroneopterin aldolase [Bacteroides sp.]MCM1366864.1 dihydroneopterin aldolase [Prevotella sp.]